MNDADADILAAVRGKFVPAPPARLGVAISGGGDSTALLHILAQCFEPGTVELMAATVDHGLRAESAQEAEGVASVAQSLGVSHDILRWQGWDGAGNLQDQARRARYQLLTDWAKSNDITMLALGHTADDQAETVLMRLSRAAGVTGLAGMPLRRTQYGVAIQRPMLDLTRLQLRDFLNRRGVGWIDDPSNEDLRFDRIKARKIMEVLEPLGVTAAALSKVAQNMNQAREALDWYSFLSARDMVAIDGGDVVFDSRKFRTLPDEICRRLLIRAISWISGAEYPPRQASMNDVLQAIRNGVSATLGGCRVLCVRHTIWVCREFNAVRRHHCAPDQIWDQRWRLQGGEGAECELRPLGRAGLMQCGDWRATKRPHASLMASPSVWRGDELIAAPLAGMAAKWQAELVGGGEEFFASLLSH